MPPAGERDTETTKKRLVNYEATPVSIKSCDIYLLANTNL
jgi:hypothetical protein